MSVPPEKIPPLPKVPSPLALSWNYFRMRYLSTIASGLALVIAVWLWARNVTESGAGGGSNANAATSSAERQAGGFISTNLPDLQTTVTNGNLGLGGGL